ncbi:hypothetical protein OG762_50380 (plasmid) [Streptomyces sp. NBC_01136]|uniref:DUF6585 family protein n=1 Tax=unclassified Streptomyces TaxID=2593676 RepID=UPI002F9171BA|nr:hypothetical protein OG762_50380 [Streptomyces sp. NBC_01136]
MAVDIPPQVASAVEDRELGALIGRYPQAINRILLVQCRVYGGVFGISFLGTVLGGATGGDAAAVPVAIPLLAISVWLVLLGERIKRNRAFYLYREGIVATKSSGRIALSARWEDLQLYWEITRTGPNATGPLRDLYRLVADGRTLLRHGELRNTGPGRIMRELATAGRTPALVRLLRSGKAVPFGPLTATPTAGLVYRNETLPWATIDEIGVAQDVATVSLRGRRPILIRTAKVPDILVLIHIASSAKTSPGWFSEDE